MSAPAAWASSSTRRPPRPFFHVRKVRGRPERTTLGLFPDLTLPQARGKTGELNGKLARWRSNDYSGPSPLKSGSHRVKLEALFKDYIERHLKAHAKNPERAVYAANWFFKLYSELRTCRADQVCREDIAEIHSRLGADRSRYVANRALQLIRSVFNWGIREGLFQGPNPASGHKLFEETERTRYLQEDEMPKFFAALRDSPNRDLTDYVWIALMTGVRRGDVLSARWTDINLDRGVWTIPNPKSRDPYAAALMPEAVAVLKRRHATSASEWVFPGTGASGHLVDLKKAWGDFRTRAGLADLRSHDLRRSLGSWMVNRGASLPTIQKTLGHASFASTKPYAQLNPESVRPAIADATKAMVAAGKKKIKAPALQIVKPKQLEAGHR